MEQQEQLETLPCLADVWRALRKEFGGYNVVERFRSLGFKPIELLRQGIVPIEVFNCVAELCGIMMVVSCVHRRLFPSTLLTEDSPYWDESKLRDWSLTAESGVIEEELVDVAVQEYREQIEPSRASVEME
jgi:hypothetical protein